MGTEHSYTITVKNNQTEKDAFKYLMDADPRFILPSKESKKIIFDTLGIDYKYLKAFDLILVEGHTNKESILDISNSDSITLIELKTTKKKLLTNPYGFFFGATDNEFELATILGDRYKFCFVSIHPESKSFALRTYAELEPLIKTNRVQRQINLRKSEAPKNEP